MILAGFYLLKLSRLKQFDFLMIYLKETFKYLKRSFLPLMLAAIVPAIVLGIFSEPFTVLSFLPLYFSMTPASFFSIFWTMVADFSLRLIFPYVLIGLGLILGLSFALGMVERHFKTGKLGLVAPWNAINNSIISIVSVVPFVFVALFVLFFVQSGLVLGLRHIISGLANLPTVLDSIIVSIVSIVLFLGFLFLTIIFGVWVMVLQTYGYGYVEAFFEARRTVFKHWLKLILGLAIPVFVFTMGQTIYNFLPWHNAVLESILSVFLHLLIIVYYIAYIAVATYKANGLDRRDIRPPYLKGFK